MSNTQVVILDGRGYALVPLSNYSEALRLHGAGITIRLETTNDSTHLDRFEDFASQHPKYVELWACEPKLFALFSIKYQRADKVAL